MQRLSVSSPVRYHPLPATARIGTVSTVGMFESLRSAKEVRMRTKLRTTSLVIAVAAALAVQTARGQTPRATAASAPDLKATLDAAANALGMIRGPQRIDALSTL